MTRSTSLRRIPEPRRIPMIGVLGTVALLFAAGALPRLTYVLAVLAILVSFVPYILSAQIFPGEHAGRVPGDIWVRELSPEMTKEWYAARRITREEYEATMRSLEEY